MLTFEQIKELVELVAQRRLQGLELERSGFRLKIDGQPQQPVVVAAPPAGAAGAPPMPPMPSMPSMPMLAAEPAAASPAAAAPDEGGHIINSPIVGTFYRAPSPDAPSFTDVGSRVKKGQVLCIIEAMKLMNEIDSEYDGEVVNIYVENGQAVQYGERLFAIKTK